MTTAASLRNGRIKTLFFARQMDQTHFHCYNLILFNKIPESNKFLFIIFSSITINMPQANINNINGIAKNRKNDLHI